MKIIPQQKNSLSMEDTNETWLPVPNIDHLMVSNHARFKTIKNGKERMLTIEGSRCRTLHNGVYLSVNVKSVMQEVFPHVEYIHIAPTIFENLEGEVWRKIPDYNNIYEVSNKGRVRRLDFYADWDVSNRFIKGGLCSICYNKQGYSVVGFRNEEGKPRTHQVHRLVAYAFLPNPNNLPQINHIDGVKTNNCVENLEWCSSSHNIKHAYDTGLRKTQNNHHHQRTYSLGG